MQKQSLNSLLKPKRDELSDLQKLLKTTKGQIDDAVEQGNDALLSLHYEYEELAEKKRSLLREVEKLEDKLNKIQEKLSYAENTYGKYLEAIKEKTEE